MTDAVAERAFAAAGRLGGAEADLAVERDRTRRFDARDGALDSVSLSDTLSLGLRIFRDGRSGFSYAFGGGDGEIARMVEAASFGAGLSDPDPAHGLPDEAGLPPSSSSSSRVDRSAEGVDDGAMRAFVLEVEAAALAADPRVKRVRSATLVESLSTTGWHDSRGRSAREEHSRYHAWVDVVAESGSEGQTGYATAFARSLSALSAREIGREAATRAVRMLGARTVPSGEYPVVLENGAAAEILDVLIPSFLASQVAKGKSMLAGKAGKDVASARVTVVDDPFDGDSPGACSFDGEGVPSVRNVLLDAGRVNAFLADSFWGRRLGGGTTASCRRGSAKLPPSPGTSALLLAPGSSPLEALLREGGRCILLTEFLGLHTADPVSGDFAVGATGLLCEGGEAVAPLKSFAATGNVLELLSRVAAVGSDLRRFGSVGAPSLLVSSLSVGGE